jgi:putative MATE family efflux protein
MSQTNITLPSLWKDIKDSLSGVERDYTSGSIWKAIMMLSIPMVLEMFMESIFAVVDIFFVSKLGAEAVATVGITESLLTLLYAVAIGLSMGTTAIVSRRIGEKDPEKASLAGSQSVLIGLSLSIPIALIGLFFAPDLLRLMGASSNMIENYALYPAVMFATNAVIMLLFVNNAIFRGAGDASIAMKALWLANGINIILDPILIFGWWVFPELGILGAAVATSIGRGVGVLYQFYRFQRPNSRIRIVIRHLRADWKVIRNLIRISLGGIGQFIIATSSWIGMVRIMAVFGSVALAGYTIAVRIIIFSILPSWGMSNAAATLVGQNLGAGEPERAAKSAWYSAYINVAFLLLLGITFNLFSEFFVRIFTSDAEVIAVGARSLRIISYGYLIYGFGMVMMQAFNGAGDTRTPTIINLFCFWLFEIPFAYLLAIKLNWGIDGVLWSIVIAESLIGVISIFLFKRDKWKETKV